MAKQQDFENRIVTGGKFIERAGGGLSLKEKLARLSNTVISSNYNASFKELNSITSDNTVTPNEKISLKQEWEYIKSAFANMTANVTKMGADTSDEYIALKNAYDNLADVIEPILEDMNKTSQLTVPVGQYIEAYSSSANVLNIYLASVNNSILEDVSDIGLEVLTDYDFIKPNQSVKFTAMIYTAKTGGRVEISDEIKELYKDAETGLYPALYQWTITGTKNDSQWMQDSLGKKEVTIPYSAFSGDMVSAFFRSDMVVGE